MAKQLQRAALIGAVFVLVACLGGSGRTFADESALVARTPEQLIAEHFAAIAAGDLDALVADYADDAVVITATGVTRGKEAIREQFARLLHPTAGASGTPAVQFVQRRFTADVAWLVWVTNAGKPNELRGVETYLVRNGKIALETVGTVAVHPTAAAP